MVLVQHAYGDADTAVHVHTPTSSVFAILNKVEMDCATPSSFQVILQDKHIIIPDFNPPKIPCDYQGVTSLNGLKELVQVEGKLIFFTTASLLMNKPSDQSTKSNTPIVKMRFLKQFIENLESPNPNILWVIQMRSDAGIESSLFSSDHAAWCDTLLELYCVHDDIKKLSSL